MKMSISKTILHEIHDVCTMFFVWQRVTNTQLTALRTFFSDMYRNGKPQTNRIVYLKIELTHEIERLQ